MHVVCFQGAVAWVPLAFSRSLRTDATMVAVVAHAPESLL